MRPLRLPAEKLEAFDIRARRGERRRGDVGRLAENTWQAGALIGRVKFEPRFERAKDGLAEWVHDCLIRQEWLSGYTARMDVIMRVWEERFTVSGFNSQPFIHQNQTPVPRVKDALLRMFSQPMLISDDVEARVQEDLFTELGLPPLGVPTCFVTGLDAEDGMIVAVDLPALTLEGEATYRLSEVGRDILQLRHRDAPELTCVLTGHRFRSELSFLNPHAGEAYCPLPVYPPVARALRTRYANEQLDVVAWLACLHAPFLVPPVTV